MHKARTKKILQFLILLVFLFLIFKYFFSHKQDLDIIGNITVKDLCFLTLITLCINLIYSIKLLLILKKLGLKHIHFLKWLNIFFVSRFLNLHVTQGALAYRSLKLKKDYNFPYTKSISLNTFFTWFETVTMLIISASIIVLHGESIKIANIDIVPLLIAVTLLLIMTPFITAPLLDLNPLKTKKIIWISVKFKELAFDIKSGLKDKSLTSKITFLNFLTFGFQIFWMSICLRALSLNLSFSNLILFVVIIQISGIVRIIPGNIGLTETICGIFSQTVGWNFGSGVIISGVSRAVVYLSFAVFGLIFYNPIYWVGKRLKKRSCK